MSPWLVLLQVVSILVLLAVAVWLSPFRLEHPRAGTPLAPGEVTTSLVVINTWIAEFTPGEAVLIRTGAGTTDPVLAVVSEVSGSVLTVTAGSQTLTASGDAILGRVVLVVPYLGVIPTALGL